ncbi:hypothetical protein D9M72_409620 [compost metagenome]
MRALGQRRGRGVAPVAVLVGDDRVEHGRAVLDGHGAAGFGLARQRRGRVVGGAAVGQRALHGAHVVAHRVDGRCGGGDRVDGEVHRRRGIAHVACQVRGGDGDGVCAFGQVGLGREAPCAVGLDHGIAQQGRTVVHHDGAADLACALDLGTGVVGAAVGRDGALDGALVVHQPVEGHDAGNGVHDHVQRLALAAAVAGRIDHFGGEGVLAAGQRQARLHHRSGRCGRQQQRPGRAAERDRGRHSRRRDPRQAGGRPGRRQGHHRGQRQHRRHPSRDPGHRQGRQHHHGVRRCDPAGRYRGQGRRHMALHAQGRPGRRRTRHHRHRHEPGRQRERSHACGELHHRHDHPHRTDHRRGERRRGRRAGRADQRRHHRRPVPDAVGQGRSRQHRDHQGRHDRARHGHRRQGRQLELHPDLAAGRGRAQVHRDFDRQGRQHERAFGRVRGDHRLHAA